MNLNLSSGGGGGNYIRFSPQANAWSNQDGEFNLEKFVFDHENLQTGWMLIAPGMFEFLPDNQLGSKGSQPSPDHKRGFKAVFYNKQMGVAEWSANGAGSNMGLESLWNQVQAQAGANPGKLPVVEYKGSRPEKVGKGSTRVPIFEVTSWVARPTALQAGDDEFETVAPPPKAKPAPSKITSVVNDDEMFF